MWAFFLAPNYRNQATKPLGFGLTSRSFFDGLGSAPSFDNALKDSVARDGVRNPVCVFDVGGLLYPAVGASPIINAARAVELETGRPVPIPAIVSGPGPRHEKLNAGDESPIDLLSADPRSFLRHFVPQPPSYWEVLSSGFLYFGDAP